jgi:hypothetical protein
MPLSFPGNNSVKAFPLQRRIGVFYAIRLVSKRNRRSVLRRIPCYVTNTKWRRFTMCRLYNRACQEAEGAGFACAVVQALFRRNLLPPSSGVKCWCPPTTPWNLKSHKIKCRRGFVFGKGVGLNPDRVFGNLE